MKELYEKIEVFGFHGCKKETKEILLDNISLFRNSENDYDWLGNGVYFWENDYERARRWAFNSYGEDAAVLGAKIRLGSCFDLSNTFSKQMLKESFEDFRMMCETLHLPMPHNANYTGFLGNPNDLVLRRLDRAVLEYLFSNLPIDEFQTVRAPFQEGFEVFPGSAFRELDHIQLCVRDLDSITAVFDADLRPLKI